MQTIKFQIFDVTAMRLLTKKNKQKKQTNNNRTK